LQAHAGADLKTREQETAEGGRTEGGKEISGTRENLKNHIRLKGVGRNGSEKHGKDRMLDKFHLTHIEELLRGEEEKCKRPEDRSVRA